MNLLYQNIIGTKIIEESTGQLLGLLKDIIINADTGKIEGLWVAPAILPISNAVLKTSSIIKWGSKIYIHSDKELGPAEDFIHISSIIQQERLIIGNYVRDDNGMYLGQVYDFQFDSSHFQLKNIYTQKQFLIFSWFNRIFSWQSIKRVDSDQIIF